MTKTYAVLQKKLQELELQIHHAHAYAHTNPTLYHPTTLSQEIQHKFVFIASLLSAEIASCPSKPRHLKHIARRLNQLEAAFRDWGRSSTVAEDLLEHADDASSCSCTESCLNDDGEAASDGPSDSEDPEKRSDCLEGEKMEMGFWEEGDEGGEFYECMVDEKEATEEEMKMEEREMVGVGGKKLCGAMASGFLIGVALMGAAVLFEFSGYLQVEENGDFVIPPT